MVSLLSPTPWDFALDYHSTGNVLPQDIRVRLDAFTEWLIE